MNNKEKVRGIYFFVLLTTICFAGCVESYQKQVQRRWNENLANRRAIADNFRNSGVGLLSTQQLNVLLTSPDLKTTPKELEMLIPAEWDLKKGTPSREEIMTDLWDRYRHCKKDRPRLSETVTAKSWREEYLEFTSCVLWIYDESKHFDEPLGCVRLFVTYIFFVEDSEILGTAGFVSHEPFLGRQK